MLKNFFETIENTAPDLTPKNTISCPESNSIPANPQFLWYREFSSGQIPKEKAFAVIWHDKEFLYAASVMEDSDVYTTASGNSDRTWEKGDVMELFFQPAGKEEYFEVHLTPSQATLFLYFPNSEARKGVLEDALTDKKFEYELVPFCASANISGWYGRMKIRLKDLNTSADTLKGSKLAVCRYNYNRGTTAPEVSSSADFTGFKTFHTPQAWHKIV